MRKKIKNLIKEGIELQVSPETAGLNPEELRRFFKAVMQAYEQVKKDKR